MIGVVIDDDVVAVPVPIAHIGNIHRCDAEVESPEPEAAGAASDQAPAMGMADAPGEAAVFPGMVEVKAGIVAAGIVADPLAVVMDVRRFGMALLIAEMPGELRADALRPGGRLEGSAASCRARAVAPGEERNRHQPRAPAP